MIAIWNQKEIYMGYSMKDYDEIISKLGLNGIKFKTKVINRNNSVVLGSFRCKTRTCAQNLEYTYQYYIYVHKDNYELACRIVK
ncbi:hypothetical protein [Vallitalea okinawensis]|uniref:hypothetical protein n=1 Tax=Vallitalea okinawensis TaxID=2078660 RepID=UPI000CFB6D4E|nr:hypothetical protein [Vallitalea okinawensis]